MSSGEAWKALDLLSVSRLNQKTVYISDKPPFWHQNLVMYLPMNEGSGTITFDESGYGNNAYLYGASWTSGIYGFGLYFDGSDDYVVVPSSSSFDVSDFSISFWAKVNAFTATYPTVINRKPMSDTTGFIWLRIHSDRVCLVYSDGNTTRLQTWETTNSTNTWYHFVLVKSGNYLSLYKNGVNLGTVTVTFAPVVGGDIYIGTYQGDTSGTYSFNGVIDDVRFFTTGISESEVQALATGAKQTYPGQLWFDTSANKLKMRSADNNTWIGTFPPSSHSHDASDITSGTLSIDRIPTLPRSKISDFFSTPFWVNIPDKPSTFPPASHTHDASEVISGVFAEARIPHTFQQSVTFNSVPFFNYGLVSYSGAIIVDSTLEFASSSTSTTILEAFFGDEWYPRFKVDLVGRMEWGSGSSTPDTNLYRHTANVLRTDSTFSAAAYQVGTTTVIDSSRVLRNIANVACSLVPSTSGLLLGSTTTRWSTLYVASVNASDTSYTASIYPTTSGLFNLGAPDSRWNYVVSNYLQAYSGLLIGTTTVIDSNRVLQNVTADASIITSGEFALARIPTLDWTKMPFTTWSGLLSQIGTTVGTFLNLTSLQIGGTTVITSTRGLVNVTADASIITSGTFAEARIPHTFASPLVLSNTYISRQGTTETVEAYEVEGLRWSDYLGQYIYVPLFRILGSGRLEWSNETPDNILFDVNLYRGGADILKTDDLLEIAGLRIGGLLILDSSRRLHNIASVNTSLTPTIDATYSLGTASARWNAHIHTLNTYGEVWTASIYPRSTNLFNLGGSSYVWNIAYIRHLYVYGSSPTLFMYATDATTPWLRFYISASERGRFGYSTSDYFAWYDAVNARELGKWSRDGFLTLRLYPGAVTPTLEFTGNRGGTVDTTIGNINWTDTFLSGNRTLALRGHYESGFDNYTLNVLFWTGSTWQTLWSIVVKSSGIAGGAFMCLLTNRTVLQGFDASSYHWLRYSYSDDSDLILGIRRSAANNYVFDFRGRVNADDIFSKNFANLKPPANWISMPATHSPVTTFSMSANHVYWIPIILPTRSRITALGFHVYTAGPSGSLAKMAIYNTGSTFRPYERLLETASVAVDTTGAKSIAVDITLDAGCYFLAIISTAAITIYAYSSVYIFAVMGYTGPAGSACTYCVHNMGSYDFPSPATFSLASGAAPALFANVGLP